MISARKHAAIDRFLSLTEVEDRGDTLLVRVPDEEGVSQFGGTVLMMVTSAASRRAPAGTRLHSLHAQFLRPVLGGAPIEIAVDVVKAGRSVSNHLVTAQQNEKPVMVMMGSFTADTDGYDYDATGLGEDLALPDDLPAEAPGDENEHPDDWPWETRWIGATPPRPDGTYESTHRHWFRIPRPLPDDPDLHLALFAYATDWTGTGGRPLALEGDTTGMISLDHAAWFHRPCRADDWHLMDVHSLVNAGGRGTLRSQIRNTEGRIVASMAQEMLLRPN